MWFVLRLVVVTCVCLSCCLYCLDCVEIALDNSVVVCFELLDLLCLSICVDCLFWFIVLNG